MLWGRQAWGVWWTWDPRLTTALILCFIYAGYLSLEHLELAPVRRQKICAVLGILGFLDVPLVFFSARLWRSIHPAVFTAEGAAMSEEMLLIHPAMGVSSANVAPEYGTEETRAYLRLDRVEKKLFELGLVKEITDLTPVLQRAAVNTGRWRKWMVDGKDKLTTEEVLADEEMTKVITDIAGHYTFETKEVAPVIEKLLDNLEKAQVPARRYVVDKIKESIGHYVTCYNLRGLTSRLKEEL